MHSLLIKKNERIDYRYIKTISYYCYNIYLQRQKINVRLRDNIKFTNVYYDTLFSFFIDYFSNAKN